MANEFSVMLDKATKFSPLILLTRANASKEPTFHSRRSSSYGIAAAECVTCPKRNGVPRFTNTAFQKPTASCTAGSRKSSTADSTTTEGIVFQGSQPGRPSSPCAGQMLGRPAARLPRPPAKALRLIVARRSAIAPFPVLNCRHPRRGSLRQGRNCGTLTKAKFQPPPLAPRSLAIPRWIHRLRGGRPGYSASNSSRRRRKGSYLGSKLRVRGSKLGSGGRAPRPGIGLKGRNSSHKYQAGGRDSNS